MFIKQLVIFSTRVRSYHSEIKELRKICSKRGYFISKETKRKGERYARKKLRNQTFERSRGAITMAFNCRKGTLPLIVIAVH